MFKKYRVRIYLKNGRIIKVRADDAEVTMTNGVVMGYNLVGASENLVKVTISEISAIVVD